jgi:hypothetical protein
MTEEENRLAEQLVMAGRLHAIVMNTNSPREIKSLSKLIDPDMLQGFLDSKPQGFVFTEVVEQAIRLARTFKSLSKG